MNAQAADAFSKWIHGFSWEKGEHDDGRFYLFVLRYWEEVQGLPDCSDLREVIHKEVLKRGDWQDSDHLKETIARWVEKAELIMDFLTLTSGK